MTDCPRCNGAGGRTVQTYTMPCWVDETPTEEWRTCAVCRGAGRLTPVQRAIYRARGAPPPPDARTFA